MLKTINIGLCNQSYSKSNIGHLWGYNIE